MSPFVFCSKNDNGFNAKVNRKTESLSPLNIPFGKFIALDTLVPLPVLGVGVVAYVFESVSMAAIK